MPESASEWLRIFADRAISPGRKQLITFKKVRNIKTILEKLDIYLNHW